MKRNDGLIEWRIKTGVLDFSLNERFFPRFWVRDLRNFAAEMTPGANLVLRVEILHVFRVASRNQYVLVSIQIHSQENRGPRPVRSGETGVVGNLSERAIPAVLQERIAHHLGAIINRADWRTNGRLRETLPLAQLLA